MTISHRQHCLLHSLPLASSLRGSELWPSQQGEQSCAGSGRCAWGKRLEGAGGKQWAFKSRALLSSGSQPLVKVYLPEIGSLATRFFSRLLYAHRISNIRYVRAQICGENHQGTTISCTRCCRDRQG